MKKSTSYRATFRRHRKVLVLPMILAVVLGGYIAATAPKSYMSTTSLWVDDAAPMASSLTDANPDMTPPSQAEQGILTELLSTSEFADAVAHQSTLAQYLASHPAGKSGISGLLSKVTGSKPSSLEAAIAAAIAPTTVTSAIPGPQILQITFSGPAPSVAQSTLKALVTVLQQESDQFAAQHNHASSGYYEAQVQSALKALTTARNDATIYFHQHPGATASNDPNVGALNTAIQGAQTQLTQAKASLSSTAGTSGAGSTIQVVDPATFPVGPTSGKKKLIEGFMGSLIAGALITFLGTILLTRRETDPWEDEIAEGNRGNALGVAAINGGIQLVGIAMTSNGVPAGITQVAPVAYAHPDGGGLALATNGTAPPSLETTTGSAPPAVQNGTDTTPEPATNGHVNGSHVEAPETPASTPRPRQPHQPHQSTDMLSRHRFAGLRAARRHARKSSPDA